MKNIAIIGAGLSGLTAANHLKEIANITIFEKARGVSGRMSTRRAEPYFFDHGAQYFTARAESFKDFIQPLIDDGLIKRWDAKYVTFEGSNIINRKDRLQEEPRYVGVPAMNSIAKHLAKNLHINLQTKIINLKKESGWKLFDEQGKIYENFDWVICTAPSPQTTDLLPEAFKYYDDISKIKMRACFSLMLGFSKPLDLDFTAAHIKNSDLSWIAVDNDKPGRPDAFTLMIHSSAEYADNHIDDNRTEVMQHMCKEASHIIGHDVSSADYKTLHGWRFADNAEDVSHEPFIDKNLNLAACGDWCLGGRVEGAFTSAYSLSEKLKEII